jgi:hypothetical protein
LAIVGSEIVVLMWCSPYYQTLSESEEVGSSHGFRALA